jgi:integrase
MRDSLQPGHRAPASAPTVSARKAGPRVLTANFIEGLKPEADLYEITDPGCPGLKLRIFPTGVKAWAFRFYWKHKRQLVSFGLWPACKLAEAHELALQAREVLRKGIDPRKAAIVKGARRPKLPPLPVVTATIAVTTATSPLPAGKEIPPLLSDNPDAVPSDPHSIPFLAHEYYHRHVIKERRRKRPEYVKRILNADVLPEWHGRDARSITGREVIELLDKLVDRGSPVMANRVGQMLGQMFRYGIHRSIVADSPVKLLYQPGGREKPRSRALNAQELKSFVLNLKTICRTRRSRHFLMLLLLTMQRRQELALAKKSAFDLKARNWTIPDEDSKNGRGHIVPLSDWAIEEIRGLIELSGDSRYLLPVKGHDRPINPKLITRTVSRLLERFKKAGIAAFTPHDLRRTGRTGLSGLGGIDREIRERVLNHQKEGMDLVYDQHEFLNEKRDALERWGKHLTDLRDQALREQQASSAATQQTTLSKSPPRAKKTRTLLR